MSSPAEPMTDLERRLAGMPPEKRALFELALAKRRAEAAVGGAPADDAAVAAGMAAIPRRPPGIDIPLSVDQERLWFIQQVNLASPAYNVYGADRFRGPLSVPTFEAALVGVVARHEILRTTFPAALDGRPLQVVAPHLAVSVPLVDLSGLPGDLREAEAQRVAKQQVNRPFRLTELPLFRLILLRMSAVDHIAPVAIHHIITDWVSYYTMQSELARLYEALRRGEPSPLSDPAFQFADFAVWQRGYLADGKVYGEALDYWKRRLADAPPYLPLPYDRPRPAVQTPWGARRRLVLSKGHSDTLRRLAQSEQTTLFVASLAAFKALLSRLSGDERLIVGTPSAYRHGPEMQTVLGFFLNQLALYSDLSGNPPFLEVVRRVKAVALGAYAHQEVPFARVVEEVAPERDLSHTPLTQIVYLLLSPHQLGLARISDLESEPYWVDARRTQWDMTFSLWDYDSGLLGWMEYNTDLFDATTIDRMKEQFRQLLVAALDDPSCPYWDLPLLTAGQRHQLLAEWGDGGAAGWEAIGERVARAAREMPEAPAVLSDLGELTFGVLAERVEILATHLASLGVGPETIVGVCLPRSPELVVALLAVLETGGAFLPLDPALPGGRLQLLLGEAKAPFVVTDRAGLGLLGKGEWQGVLLEAVGAGFQPPGEERCRRSQQRAHPDQLAYVLFTSGSTGQPKGVMVPHRGLANYLAWCLAAYGPESGRGAPVHTSIGFDLTLTGLLAPLAAGRPVRFVPESLGADALAQILQQEQGWSLIKLTPAHLQVLALTPSVPLSRDGRGGSPPPTETPEAGQSGLDQVPLSRLGRGDRGEGSGEADEDFQGIARTLVVGGEALHAELLAPFRETGIAVVNEYGPTEATVGCTAHFVSETDPAAGPVSIGRPIAGTAIVILDKTGRPVPPGVHGELAIGGAGLARGYLGAPELTAERFTPHPEPRASGERLYRTGDRARFGAAGRLEFIGRLDSQIKLRGFRIEPAEVEEALRRQPGIDDAAVGVVGERLVAWVVSAGRLDPKVVSAGLRQLLPEAMVPADFVRLPALPRTANGKLDKGALPVPGQERRAALYAAPRSFVEATLVEIWRETLRLPRVGIYDNFFDLGGHSLVAIQAMARLRKSLGVELRVQHLFEAPTVAKLARRVEEATAVSRAPILPASAERRRRAPLSFAQQRLWFLDRLLGPSALYNMFFPLRLAGPLEPEALAAAVGEIFRRHEVLRARFAEGTGGLPVQVVGPVPAAPLPRLDLRALPAAAREGELARLLEQEVRRPFDLTAEPLLRALLAELGKGDHALLLTLHHIASDGWSMGVLGYELGSLYAAYHKGWTSPLPELPLQYADYAVWQRDQALDPSGLAVWREKLAGAPPEIPLPLDRPRPRELSFRGRVAVRHLPAARMEGLREPAKKAQTTPFMTLLAAWAALLARTGGGTDLPLGTPAANRTRTEIEGLIGFFVNTVIVRADLAGRPKVSDLLSRVRSEVLWTFAHQEVPFERLVEELAPDRTLGRNPLTQVMFSLQSFPQEAPDLSGLAATSLAGDSLDTGTSKFDLTLFVWGTEGEVRSVLEYNSDLFDAATAERLLGGFERLLEGFAGDLSRPVAELPLLGEAERAEVLAAGAARQGAGEVRALGELFAEQARQRPEAPALTFGGRHVTYGELDGRSRRLAGYLAGMRPSPPRSPSPGLPPPAPGEREALHPGFPKDPGPAGSATFPSPVSGEGTGERDTPHPDTVALFCERTPEMIVAILAVLRAGMAYVPLDPQLPEERLRYLLEDCGASVILKGPGATLPESLAARSQHGDLLVGAGLGARGDGRPARGEGIDDRTQGGSPAQAATQTRPYTKHARSRLVVLDLADLEPRLEGDGPQLPQVDPALTAYWIYTSGSTGNPKPVAVPHAQVVRLLSSSEEHFGFGPDDVWTLFHSYAFDFSVWEIWGALAYGGRLVVVPYLDSRSTEDFASILERERVTVLNQTPSAFHQLVAHEEQAGAAVGPALRWVIFGGEPLEIGRLAPWWSRHGGSPRLVNMYGITETTVHVTFHLVEPDEARGVGTAIGRPLADLALYVLDPLGEPCPPGVAGELVVGGAGLARGYAGRPALTAKRFVPDPFAGEAGARLYRSGDLGRLLADGRFEHLGRADRQVKIRGFRIELGEIEAALAAFPGVAQAAVVVRGGEAREAKLVAYLVGAPPPAVDALRAFLAARLPSHMVPAAFVSLSALPLTANGKLDTRALPDPAGARPELAAGYAPPESFSEEVLAAVWSEALGLDEVGVRDNFFALGGDSIRALQVVSAARQRGVGFALTDLFTHQTIGELAAALDAGRAERLAAASAPFSLVSPADRAAMPPGVEDAYPLTQLQAGMLYHLELTPEYPLYHNIASFPTALPLDPDPGLFRRAVNEVVARHPILRTGFDMTGFSEPLQLVHRHAEMTVPVIDLRRLPEEARTAELAAFAAAEKHRLFDLARPPLLRFALHRLTDETVQFTLTENHAILDGWSLNSTLAETARRFLALRADPALPPEPPPPVLFRDYVRLEQAALADPAQKAFWDRELAQATVVPLPRAGEPRPAEDPVSNRRAIVPGDRFGRLRALARELGLPVKSLLFAVHLKVVGLLSGTADALTGLVIHGRPEEAGGDQVRGLMLNTVPFRLGLDFPTWRELVRAVFEHERELLPHRRYPFAAVQRERGREPLYQTVFNHTNFHVWESLSADLEDDPEGFGEELEETEFPLIVNWNVGVTGRLRIALYAVLSDEQTDTVLGYYLRALEALATEPGADPRAAALLSAEERQQVLAAWQGERPAAPAPAVHRRFEAQARRQPAAPALVAPDGRTSSYAEVDLLVETLAAALTARGVRAEDRVGVCLEQGWEIPVVLLAVLKAGACYLPLDPSYPAERLAFMLADSGAALVVTGGAAADSLPAGTPDLLSLDEGWERRLPAGPEREEPARMPALPAESLAYLIYTSGSTGRPKGVAVPHRTLARLIDWQIAADGGEEPARTLQLSSPSFDVSLQEVFATWCAGGTLVAASPELRRDPARLLARLGEERVERLFLPYVALQQLADAVAQGGPAPRSLRRVVTAGEQLRATPEIRALFAALPGAGLANQYGPSETHVVTEHRLLGEPAAWPELPPIGRPIAGTTAFVLDPWGAPAPVAVPGELYLGGEGVARGYLGRPDLTAERFVPDASGGAAGGRLYRTGDRVRWMPGRSEDAGEIEFLGRIDEQVKIRGYRVEPGEVEAALIAHPAIIEAAVVVTGGGAGGRRLAAYVVSRGIPPEAAELRRHLAARLPEPMVPEVFVSLPALPLTPSGKLDRRALPEPHAAAEARPADAPRDPIEAGLAAIWAEVLEVPAVGRDGGFFELGGHSLSASRAVSRVRRTFGVEAPLRSLFEAPTPAAFAAVVRKALAAGEPAPPAPGRAGRRSGPPPLSFAQQRLWFLSRLEPDSPAYHMPFAFDLAGKLDAAALARGFAEVVRRHEVLRTVIAAPDGRPVQVVGPPPGSVLALVDLSALPTGRRAGEAEEVQAEIVLRPFRLDVLPPLRAALLRLEEGAHRAVVNVHHIACDGVSLGVLAREVGTLYAAFATGRPSPPSPLPDLPLQYGDYAAWQRDWLQGEALEGLLAWWRGRLAGAPPVLELPTDRPRRAAGDRRAAVQGVHLPATAAAQAAELGRRSGATPFMVFLAAWQALLGRLAGTGDVVVGTPVAGRNRPELEELVGFFVNNLALRTDLSGSPGLRLLVERVRETTLGALAHQDLPFERLVEELAPERDLAVTPIFQAILSVEVAPPPAPALAGLAVSPRMADPARAKFELDLAAVPEEGGGIALRLAFDAGLYDPATADRLLVRLVLLLEAALTDPEKPLPAIDLMSAAERAEVLAAGAVRQAPREVRPLHERFAEQAARRPEAPALTFAGRHVSYSELERRSARLARHLVARGIALDSPVALLSDRTPEMIVALLAVLRAGAAYVPLDPQLPPERLRLLLDDCGASLLLQCPGTLLPEALETGTGLAVLDLAAFESVPEETGGELPAVDPASTAYWIYTSGSTGTPKPVAVPHAQVARLLSASEGAFGFGEDDVWTLFHSYAFDFSVWEIWGALAHGGRLVLVPYLESRSPEALARLLDEQRVTVLNQTPSAFYQLVDYEEQSGQKIGASLSWVIFGGEPLEVARLAPWWSRHGETPRLVNMYGITETTVHVTFHPVERDEAGGFGTAIGRPLPDLSFFVLDPQGELCPPGVPGELAVGGAGPARGYGGRPGPTAERFVPDPWSAEPGGRLYLSGDLGRLVEGRFEHWGRADRQIKIRGFRIEPGEIEAALTAHPAVRDAAVVAWDDGPAGRRLAAYVVATEEALTASAGGDAAGRVAELADFLAARLPGHMVPASVTVLADLPRTANGKLDRAALPRPVIAAGGAPPAGPTEEALAAIWAELLALPRVGAEDNFFALGGHSLLAVQAVSRVRDRLGREVPLAELFERPTVRRLAAWLDQEEAAAAKPVGTIGRAARERFKVRRDDLGGGGPRGPA